MGLKAATSRRGQPTAGSPTVESADPHDGTYHGYFARTTTGACYVRKTGFNLSEVYARGYFKFSGNLPSNYADLMYLNGNGENVVCSVQLASDGWVIYCRNGEGIVEDSYGVAPALNVWYCVEVHLVIDGSGGLEEVYLNGTKVAEITGVDTNNYGSFQSLYAGFPWVSISSAIQTKLDCVVVDSGYVGPESGSSYSISASADSNSTINPSGTVNVASGGSQAFTISANTGYHLTHVYVDSADPGAISNYTFTNVTANHSISVTSAVNMSSIFNDGFESGNFSLWTGTTGSPTVESNDPHDGSHEAYFTRASTGACFVRKTGLNLSEVYVRGYFKLSGTLPSNYADLIYLEDSNHNVIASVQIHSNSWELYVRDGGSVASAVYASAPVLNQWCCVELHLKIDNSAGLAELYIDGTKHAELTGKDTNNYGNAQWLTAGLPWVSVTSAIQTKLWTA